MARLIFGLLFFGLSVCHTAFLSTGKCAYKKISIRSFTGCSSKTDAYFLHKKINILNEFMCVWIFVIFLDETCIGHNVEHMQKEALNMLETNVGEKQHIWAKIKN